MKRLIQALALSSLLFAARAQAEIIEVKTVHDALTFLEDDSLVIFDLDNTVIEATTSLGGDQWFNRLVELNLGAGMTPQAAKNAAVARWLKVQPFVEVRAVERDTPARIRELQELGYTVMGLTARPEPARADTMRQLACVDVRFADDVALPDGILFVNNGDKGEALLALAQKQGRTLTRVIFIDDKQHNVEAVHAALERWNAAHPEDGYIYHLEARYGAADPRVAAYDHSLAELQERLLFGIVDDAEAGLIRDALAAKAVSVP